MSRMFLGSVALASLVLLGGLTSTSDAGIIVEALKVEASEPSITAASVIQRVIDNSGLATYTAGDDFDAFLATNPLHDDDVNDEFISGFGVNRDIAIDFTFASLFETSRLAIWNDDDAPISRLRVFSSANEEFSSLTELADIVPVAPTPDMDYEHEVIDFNQIIETQYIRLLVTTTPTLASAEQVGLGEVVFEQHMDANPVPEPATIAIWSLIGGVGLIGYRRRRLKKS